MFLSLKALVWIWADQKGFLVFVLIQRYRRGATKLDAIKKITQ